MINNNTTSFQSLKNVYSQKLFYKTEEEERKIEMKMNKKIIKIKRKAIFFSTISFTK